MYSDALNYTNNSSKIADYGSFIGRTVFMHEIEHQSYLTNDKKSSVLLHVLKVIEVIDIKLHTLEVIDICTMFFFIYKIVDIVMFC